eukprot:6360697-Prymnesium_polylepis.1
MSGTDAGTSGGRAGRWAQAAGARARAAREWRVSGGCCACGRGPRLVCVCYGPTGRGTRTGH